MAEQKPGEKKAVTKKSVAKTAAIKKAPVKKAAAKKSPVKKRISAKSPPASTINGEALNKSIEDSNTQNKETLATIQSIVEEMRKEHDNRDQQMHSLVKEIRKGFSSHSDIYKAQDSERDKEMAKLYETLQGAFHNVKKTNSKNEDRSLIILKSLTDSIMKDHEQTLKEVHEQEKLQDKKFQQLTKVEERRDGRNRWIAIPGMIIAVIAIIYMFYVVSIMEGAMTSMSKDMGEMQIAVGNMSHKMDGMSGDTHSMNGSMQQLNSSVEKMSQDTNSMNSNMQKLSEDTEAMTSSLTHLNNNVGVMSQDLNIMTNNVAPTMKGMRDMMPWSP